MSDLRQRAERIDQMIEDAQAEHDIELSIECRKLVHGHPLIDFDFGLQQLMSDVQSFAATPVLSDVICRQNLGRTAPFSLEAPIAVPTTDVEHTLAMKIDLIQLL